uniref:uncharacterized protein LOC117163070 n=1 Tax=Bombus vancouverensis nearcticus TaxID=2705178 RepID=UPI00143BFDC2|nr:uncharacterized protein LOC117163070 [Bombus vancouverensis nearcticus]
MWIISFSKLLITNRIVSLFDYKEFLKFYSFDDALLTWNIHILLRSCSFNTASLTWSIPAVRTASSGSSYVLNTYYGYLYPSYIYCCVSVDLFVAMSHIFLIFEFSFPLDNRKSIVEQQSLTVIAIKVSLSIPFQLTDAYYVLWNGSIICLCGIPACTLPSTMINRALGFHYLHYSISSVTLPLA